MPDLRRRYKPEVAADLAQGLHGAVTTHAPDHAELMGLASGLTEIGKQLLAAFESQLGNLELLDFNRDELARAISLTVQGASHRIDRPDLQAAAQRVLMAHFSGGIGWTREPHAVESARLAEIRLSAETPVLQADITQLGLTEAYAALFQAEDVFLAGVRTQGARAGEIKKALLSRRELLDTFHAKLDRYVTVVRDEFRGSDPQRQAQREALLAPLVRATGASRAAQTRTTRGTADPATPPPTEPPPV